MSILEFVGAINPWPESDNIPAVKAHKSRLLLQARLIDRSIDPGPWERMVARSLYHGAAKWEFWLLQHASEPVEGQKECAHSAVTLAQRSGDWSLVDQILSKWRTIGQGHERFYRDATRSFEAHREAFGENLARLKAMSRGLQASRDLDAARALLRQTDRYADDGGSGYVLWFRGLAHVILAERGLARRESFMACVAEPFDSRLAEQWILRSVQGEVAQERTSLSRERATARFASELAVLAAALFADNERHAASGPPPSRAEVDAVATLALSSNAPDRDRAFAIYNAAWALTQRDAKEQAFDLLSEALRRIPSQLGVLLLRANAALSIGRAEVLATLLSDAERHAPSASEWRTVANLLSSGQRWRDALVAFERAGIDRLVAADAPIDARWMNDYAIVLTHLGRDAEARALLERAARDWPDDLHVRQNLTALSDARIQDLTPANDDFFASIIREGLAA